MNLTIMAVIIFIEKEDLINLLLFSNESLKWLHNHVGNGGVPKLL